MCSKETLQTPLQKKILPLRNMLIYPDIFEVGSFGARSESESAIRKDSNESWRWKEVPTDISYGEIASCLLLVKAIGARVTPYLLEGVTHILCDINSEAIQWNSQVSINILFRDGQRGNAIHQKLLSMQSSVNKNTKITLVSPMWFRKHWRP